NTVRGDAATEGSQSVDAKNGTVAADRSASGSITGSTASLADLPVPGLANSASGSANGNASGQGSANAQLLGTNDVTNAVGPVASQAQSVVGNAAGSAAGQAQGAADSALANVPAIPSAPAPGLPALGGAVGGAGSAAGNGSASLMSTPLAVAGTAAAAADGAGTVTPGMPVMTPEGASLGKVDQIVADGSGQVQQLVVTQGNVTRTLPAGMFTATGNALIAGEAQGEAQGDASAQGAQDAEPAAAPEGGEAN
ncbi:MAG: hypothetical protein CL955_08830, partial [Erythrobacteraceae bacterium]|nr:hypothetical protein [Erythrobacteraceae bacterium]